jgi:hypothetical protein
MNPQRSSTEGENFSENGRGNVPVTRLVIPVISAIVAISAIVSWTWIAAAQFGEIHLQITNTRNELAAQIREVSYKLELQEARFADRYTASDHRQFVLDLMRLNPTLKLPENR